VARLRKDETERPVALQASARGAAPVGPYRIKRMLAARLISARICGTSCGLCELRRGDVAAARLLIVARGIRTELGRSPFSGDVGTAGARDTNCRGGPCLRARSMNTASQS
jgi:hypothetical protein